MSFKSLLVAAMVFVAPLSAKALTVSGDFAAAPIPNFISGGSILFQEIDGDAIDVGGIIGWTFTATEALDTAVTASINPRSNGVLKGFTDAVMFWAGSLGGAPVLEALTSAQTINGEVLYRSFAAGETAYLFASWADVVDDKSNFDIRLEATTSVVPLPATAILFISALGGLMILGRRRTV